MRIGITSKDWNNVQQVSELKNVAVSSAVISRRTLIAEEGNDYHDSKLMNVAISSAVISETWFQLSCVVEDYFNPIQNQRKSNPHPIQNQFNQCISNPEPINPFGNQSKANAINSKPIQDPSDSNANLIKINPKPIQNQFKTVSTTFGLPLTTQISVLSYLC